MQKETAAAERGPAVEAERSSQAAEEDYGC